jgi:hypothetical protein
MDVQACEGRGAVKLAPLRRRSRGERTAMSEITRTAVEVAAMLEGAGRSPFLMPMH